MKVANHIQGLVVAALKDRVANGFLGWRVGREPLLFVSFIIL